MIYCKMDGRLGNQLFRYAYARKLSIDFKDEIVFDFSNCYRKGFDNDLKGFNVIDIVEKKVHIPLLQRVLLFFTRSLKKFLLLFVPKHKKRIFDDKFSLLAAKVLNRFNILYISEGFYDFKIKDYDILYLNGMFESANYFNSIKKILINEISPKYINPGIETMASSIRISNSICITIRRGDFLNSKFKTSHFVCDEGYFYEAIKKMNKLVINPKYYVFSDDIEWVKNNMSFPDGTVFEKLGLSIEEKLYLMSSCNNFILSNSTFSWWSQFLCKNDKKIVISPKRWSNVDYISDLISEDWMLI